MLHPIIIVPFGPQHSTFAGSKCAIMFDTALFFFAKTAYKYGLFLILEFQGFRYVASGPMVRSSYKAGEFYIKAMIEADRVKTSTVDLSS